MTRPIVAGSCGIGNPCTSAHQEWPRARASVDLGRQRTGLANHRLLRAWEGLRREAVRLLTGVEGAFAGYERLEVFLEQPIFEGGHLRLTLVVFDATPRSFHARFAALYADPSQGAQVTPWVMVAEGAGQIVAAVGADSASRRFDPGLACASPGRVAWKGQRDVEVSSILTTVSWHAANGADKTGRLIGHA